MNNKIYLHITSGRGPTECCRVVALILERILDHSRKLGLSAEILYREPGPLNRTLFSAVLSVEGDGCEKLAGEWQGIIQWISRSPYRTHYQRKNWFVGINAYKQPAAYGFSEKEITYQTLRASGPGGQHVNKTETAVRAVHAPSGISVIASDQRSQQQNKKLATERLMQRLAAWYVEQAMQVAQQNWNNHNDLQRGNPVKVIKEEFR